MPAEEHSDDLDALIALTEALLHAPTARDVARVVARSMTETVGSIRGAVVLVDGHSGPARVAATFGYAHDVDEELRSVSLDGLGTERLESEFRTIAGSRSITSVPIVDGECAIGALVVDPAPEPCEAESVAVLLRAVAGCAAHALRTARLAEALHDVDAHDELTGLPRRVLVVDRAEQMLTRARRAQHPIAALCIDIDDFGSVNAHYGDAAGDALLRAIAVRLRSGLRDTDTVGRLADDEFVVLADGVSLAAGPEGFADRLADLLIQPFRLVGFEDLVLRISVSVGIAAGLRADAETLLHDAQDALARAKTAGRRCVAVYHPKAS
jgi:diguanylate cyclase (GGDEF)-like protein